MLHICSKGEQDFLHLYLILILSLWNWSDSETVRAHLVMLTIFGREEGFLPSRYFGIHLKISQANYSASTTNDSVKRVWRITFKIHSDTVTNYVTFISFRYFWITAIPNMQMMTALSQLEGRTCTLLWWCFSFLLCRQNSGEISTPWKHFWIGDLED